MSKASVSAWRTGRILLLAVFLGAGTYALVWTYKYQEVGTRSFGNHSHKRVLLIGNSVTFFNEMPRMLQALSSSDEVQTLYVKRVTKPGAGLADMGHNWWVDDAIAEGWDTVIAQPQTWEGVMIDNERRGHLSWTLTDTLSSKLRRGEKLSVTGLGHLRRSAKPSRFLLFVPAPATDKAVFRSQDSAADWQYLTGKSVAVWSELSSDAELLPVAFAYLRCVAIAKGLFRNELSERLSEIPMVAADHSHPGVGGSYLIAWRLLQGIEGRELDPALEWWKPDSLTTQQAAAIRTCANRQALQ